MPKIEKKSSVRTKGPMAFSFKDNNFDCASAADKMFALVEILVEGDLDDCINQVNVGDCIQLLIPLGKGLTENQVTKCIDIALGGMIPDDTCLEWDEEKCELRVTINPPTVLDDPNTGNNPTYCTDLDKWQEVIKDPETGKLYVPPERKHGCEQEIREIFKGANLGPNDDYISIFPDAPGGWSVDTADGQEISFANGGEEARIEKTIENPADSCWKRRVNFYFDGGSHVYERGAAGNDWETLILREYSVNGGPFQLIHINATRSDTPEGQLVDSATPTVAEHETTVHPTDSYNWCNFNTGGGAGTGCLAPGESITVRQRLFFVKWAYVSHPSNRYQIGVARVICDWQEC